MYHKEDKYPDEDAYAFVINYLTKNGITLSDIADIAYSLQRSHNPEVPYEKYLSSVKEVLHKREVLNIMMTGISLDIKANGKALPEPLQTIVGRDYALYGVDEILGLGIARLYGTIGTTSYGYADKEKFGIIKELDEDGKRVTTFLDDLVGAVASAAGTKIAFSEN